MVLSIKTAVYWDVMSCIVVDVYIHSVETCCIFTAILKMNFLQEYIAYVAYSLPS